DKAHQQVNYKRPPSSFDIFKPIEHPDWCKLRPFTEAEKGAKYIHAFDKNAMYLQCVGIPLGVGNYRHMVKPNVPGQPFPGVWRVKSIPFSGCDLFNMPGAQNEWVMTPTLLLMRKLGLLRDIEERYICDDSHKLFPTYYSHMKKALALCDQSEVGETMKDFIKKMYTQGIGYLNSDLFADEWFY